MDCGKDVEDLVVDVEKEREGYDAMLGGMLFTYFYTMSRKKMLLHIVSRFLRPI